MLPKLIRTLFLTGTIFVLGYLAHEVVSWDAPAGQNADNAKSAFTSTLASIKPTSQDKVPAGTNGSNEGSAKVPTEPTFNPQKDYIYKFASGMRDLDSAELEDAENVKKLLAEGEIIEKRPTQTVEGSRKPTSSLSEPSTSGANEGHKAWQQINENL
jgi:hypothetical protein